VPFSNSGDVCCAFKDVNDIFLNLETGDLALSAPMFVATNPNLTSGVSIPPPFPLMVRSSMFPVWVKAEHTRKCGWR